VRPILLALPICTAAGLLTGCSDEHIAAVGRGTAAPLQAAEQAVVQKASPNIAARFADTALDDRGLGAIRGGFSNGSGVVVNFSFQESTYVNHNLIQNIVIPTLTVSPGSSGALVASAASGGLNNPALAANAPLANAAGQAQVSSPVQAVQSIVNSGMTSIVTNLGGGGITNSISNRANNQLVQQMITANIGITGLSQAMQQNMASTVMSRVMAANAQFR
jgi:PBP1b-binding outer membrane lipoprotein LpoB